MVYPVVQSGTGAFDEHPEFRGDYVGRLRLGGYKMILDGSPQARSAWMSEPYEPIEGDEEPGCAYPIHTPEEVEAFTRAVAEQAVSSSCTATGMPPRSCGSRPPSASAPNIRHCSRRAR